MGFYLDKKSNIRLQDLYSGKVVSRVSDNCENADAYSPASRANMHQRSDTYRFEKFARVPSSGNPHMYNLGIFQYFLPTCAKIRKILVKMQKLKFLMIFVRSLEKLRRRSSTLRMR